jgi:excisionase family DNA binding protein
MSVREAAKLIGASERTVTRYMNLGFIRAVRLPGGRRRIPRVELARLARRETQDSGHRGRFRRGR